MDSNNLIYSLGDDSSFVNMTKDEKLILKRALLEEIYRREKISTSRQIREIEPVESWLESEYFLGPNFVYLYDYWKDTIRDIFRSDRTDRITEVVLGGSIGTGKSTTSIIIMLRKFYELSCYENIPVLLNLMPTSTIVFIYFSVNKNQAEITGFGDMRSMIDSIPYFKDHFPRKEKLDSVIVFPENIMMTYGSGTQHSIGMNVLGSILDEANFFRGESSGSQVVSSSASRISDLYSSIVNRSKSRFVSSDGYDSSLSILVSSSTHESSFTEQRIRAGMKDPHTLIRTPKLWEVKPGAYSKKKFYVFQGNSSLDPFIIESVEDVNRFRLSEGLSRYTKKDEVSQVESDGDSDETEVIREAIDNLPDHHRDLFLDVPVDLKKGFDTNIIRSLQDIGGVSVAPMGRLFSSKDVYKRVCKPYLSHPFIQEAVVISTGDSVRLHDFLYPGYKFKDPSKKRFIHIDQSITSDSTGIACGYIKEMLVEDDVTKPIIALDFVLRILPPKPPKRIAIYKIRDFVIFLNRTMGLPIAKISYDIFSSEDSRQILTEMGYNAVYASVDRNDKAYTDLIEIMYEDRLEIYDYEPFRVELFSLIHNREKKKVDHGKENVDGSAGSKDTTDAVSGVVHGILSSTFSSASVYNGIDDFRMANPVSSSFYIGHGNYQEKGNVSDLIDREIGRILDEF